MNRAAISIFVCGLMLSACSALSMPAQPANAPGATTGIASAPGSAAPGAPGQTATVSGTGRFGLSVRQAPALTATRVATVPEGYQALVVGGPVKRDGFDWYQLQGEDLAGWASGSYLTFGSAQVATSSPSSAPVAGASSPSSSAPAAASTAISSVLAGLGRDSNYDVQGSGIYVQPELKPAVDHLSAAPIAQGLLQKASKVYLRVTIGHFEVTSEGGEFATLGHSIKLADTMVRESLDVQSTVLSHELQHASDILVDHMTPESAQDCVNLELRAFQAQERVWLQITKPSPPVTRMERELDQLSHVVDTSAFAQQLAKLYATECGAFSKR